MRRTRATPAVSARRPGRELLAQMTLEEKLAQLVGFWDDQGGEVVAPMQGEMRVLDAVRGGRLAARARPPHPGLRHPPGRPRRAGRVAVGSEQRRCGSRPGSASRRSSTRSASPGSPRGRRRPSRRRSRGARPSTRTSSSEMARADRRVDARPRHPPGPRPGARRHPRPALGPGRRVHRRGPVPRRHDRHGVRPRPAGRRRARHPQALRRLLGVAGRPQPRPGARGPARGRRRAPAARSRWRSATAARASVMHSYAEIDGDPGRGDAAPPHRAAARRSGASTASSSPTTSGSRSCRSCTRSRPTAARPPRSR